MDAIEREAIEAMLEHMERRELMRGFGDMRMPVVMLTGPVPDADTLVVVEAALRDHGAFLVAQGRLDMVPHDPVVPTDDFLARQVALLANAFDDTDVLERIARMDRISLKQELAPQHEEKGFYRRFEKRRPGGGFSRGKRRR